MIVDPVPLVSKMYHPIIQRKSYDFPRKVTYHPRTSASTKCYYIDFGISCIYPADCPSLKMVGALPEADWRPRNFDEDVRAHVRLLSIRAGMLTKSMFSRTVRVSTSSCSHHRSSRMVRPSRMARIAFFFVRSSSRATRLKRRTTRAS